MIHYCVCRITLWQGSTGTGGPWNLALQLVEWNAGDPIPDVRMCETIVPADEVTPKLKWALSELDAPVDRLLVINGQRVADMAELMRTVEHIIGASLGSTLDR